MKRCNGYWVMALLAALLLMPASVFAAATATPINGTAPVAAAPAPSQSAAVSTATPAPSAGAVGSAKAAATAATGAAKGGAKGAAHTSPQGAPGSMLQTLAWFAIPLGIVYLLILMPKNREDKRRRKMLGELKRGDRVVTTGGILASVVDVRDSEVVLKVDESANVKARFTRAAIAAVLPDSTPSTAEEKAPDKKK